jgi:hypothetical protein
MFTQAVYDAHYLKPRHRGMFAVDITSFGRRNPRLGILSRETLYTVIKEACAAAGICWNCCHHEDRGDAIFALAPADESIETLIDPLVARIRTGLGHRNRFLSGDAQIQVRMAINAGYVYRDSHGFTGHAVTRLFRLLDAPALKTRLAHHPGDFGLIVPDDLYQEIVGYSPGQIDAGAFQRVSVDVKETSTHGWIWLPSAQQVGSGASSAVPARPHAAHRRPSGDLRWRPPWPGRH